MSADYSPNMTRHASHTQAQSTPVAEQIDREDHRSRHLVEEDLLVEEISIDGMCGVY